MYLPAHFEEHDLDAIARLVDAHPLGALVVHGPNGLDANHVPFLFDRAAGLLQAHVARANPVWTELTDGAEALVIFRGPDGYISPNWYPSKHEAHRQVPTWNYQVVHVHGRLRIRDDEKFVRSVVARLTRTHEARTGDAVPWKMGDAPAEYLAAMLASIVGVEIEITRIVAKSKLGQNKDARDRLGAAEAVRAHGATVLADAMRDAGGQGGNG